MAFLSFLSCRNENAALTCRWRGCSPRSAALTDGAHMKETSWSIDHCWRGSCSSKEPVMLKRVAPRHGHCAYKCAAVSGYSQQNRQVVPVVWSRILWWYSRSLWPVMHSDRVRLSRVSSSSARFALSSVRKSLDILLPVYKFHSCCHCVLRLSLIKSMAPL